MTYIMGFVTAVPASGREEYIRFAEEYVPVFQRFGATRIMEAWGDDVPDGSVTDFPRAVQATGDEVVVFSWQEFPNKAAADQANQMMEGDPAMDELGSRMPFDASRMIYGGFEGVSEHGSAGKPGYIDGAVLPVPSDRKEEYKAVLERQASLFTELGATRFVDAWGDAVPDGKITDFKRAVQASDNETVVFSFIEWPSKAVRDAAWPKVMSDPRMQEPTPGDESRRIFGGFVPVVDV